MKTQVIGRKVYETLAIPQGKTTPAQTGVGYVERVRTPEGDFTLAYIFENAEDLRQHAGKLLQEYLAEQV